MTTLTLLILTLLGVDSSAQARTIERIAAIVNDQVVLLSDLEKYRTSLQSGGFVDEALLRLTDKPKLMKDRNALINHLIDERILDYEVKKKNLDITLERVEQEIRSITKRQGISRAQLREVLAQKGVAFADYQNFIKSSIERQSLIEREVSSKIKISDEDVAAYYMRKKGANQAQAFEYSLSHILFLPQNGGENDALNRAEQVRVRLKDGQSFEKLAEQYSEDPNFSQGGTLGVFKSGEMVKEIETAVKSLNEGDVTPVIKTRLGLQIIRVNKKTITSDPELEAKREEIRSLLFAEAFQRQFRSWLDQRRDEAFIRIN